jgi:branched-chain amino acid transport system ATP-binding protein
MALGLEGVGVRFGGLVALEGVSLRVPERARVGVIGPNGAGKTTLFNVICGFVAPTAGRVTLGGQPFKPRPHKLIHHKIARTLQGVNLFSGMTALENVLVANGNHDKARAALDRCGAGGLEDRKPLSLPYAIRKRVALARALVAEPDYLLLDEPAGGLGAGEIRELQELISTLDCAVLLVEHHMDLVMAVCDDILVLDFGREVAHGSPEKIKADPAVAAAYLGVA